MGKDKNKQEPEAPKKKPGRKPSPNKMERIYIWLPPKLKLKVEKMADKKTGGRVSEYGRNVLSKAVKKDKDKK